MEERARKIVAPPPGTITGPLPPPRAIAGRRPLSRAVPRRPTRPRRSWPPSLAAGWRTALFGGAVLLLFLAGWSLHGTAPPGRLLVAAGLLGVAGVAMLQADLRRRRRDKS